MINTAPETRRASGDATDESAVQVLEVRDDAVILDLPDDITDCPRCIPQDAIEFGNAAKAWFMWNMETKQPRAPHTPSVVWDFVGDGFAGHCKWGQDEVAAWKRSGSRFEDVWCSLDGNVNGFHHPSWEWPDGEEPQPLYPMLVVPHNYFSPEPGLILFDFDDVITVREDGTGMMTRESWGIIQRLDSYGEVSVSMEGVHVIVRGRIPDWVDGVSAEIQLEHGHIDVYGYPGNGRIIASTWAHIEETPVAVPERQSEVEEVLDEHVDDDEKLSDEEVVNRKVEDRKRALLQSGSADSSSRSRYYDAFDVGGIADVYPFSEYKQSSGHGPHPVHGGTDNDDSESINFQIDAKKNQWCCYKHDMEGGGPLELIAVMEGVRKCGNQSDVMQDPEAALKTCLHARDKYADGALDDETPPTVALKGALLAAGADEVPDGKLSREQFRIAMDAYENMFISGGENA